MASQDIHLLLHETCEYIPVYGKGIFFGIYVYILIKK